MALWSKPAVEAKPAAAPKPERRSVGAIETDISSEERRRQETVAKLTRELASEEEALGPEIKQKQDAAAALEGQLKKIEEAEKQLVADKAKLAPLRKKAADEAADVVAKQKTIDGLKARLRALGAPVPASHVQVPVVAKPPMQVVQGGKR